MYKAISPLVAAVLLIAVTMTIAGVLAYWASSFVRSQITLFENQTATSECNFGNFLVYLCSYNTNTSKINIILNNVGKIDLRDLVVYVIYQNNSISSFELNETLPSGGLKPFSLTGVSSDYSKISIKTYCPNVFAEVACR